MPQSRSPIAEVLALGRRAGLGHLRVEHHPHGRRLGPHRERRAEVANHRADDVALPAAARLLAVRRPPAPQPHRRARRSLPGRAIESPCPGTAFAPNRTSPPRKNAFRRLSVARVRIMPRRISRRSSRVSEASIAARRRNPSHSSSSAAAPARCAGRRVVRGVVSRSPCGTARDLQPSRELAAKRRPERLDRGLALRFARRRSPLRRRRAASVSANGYRSATNAPNRLATPVSFSSSAGFAM